VAVPYVLDPTLLPSYDGAVNPFRNISRTIPVTVDEWRGVTSGGITAAFQAEAAATTDQSPTLASVSISTEMARVAIPYTIEIGMDWSSFSSEMASEIQNSKDVIEASKFATGTGTNEPFGVITGATTLFTTSDSAALYVADFSGTHDALPPLYRSRAVWAMANSTLTRVRQLDTAGGSSMLTPNLQLRAAANVGGPGAPDMTDSRANVDLYGKAVHEASGIAVFADNAKVAVFGAFNPYYTIIDRVGLSIVDAGYAQDATTGLPNGTKFMLAYWRVGAKVIHANAFRVTRVA
jgi:HK97 family phage major capsid protein